MLKKINKLIYIVPVRLPTRKAYGQQIVKMCEAFARQGVEVELVLPRREKSGDDIFSFYGIEPVFTVKFLQVPDMIGMFGWLKIVPYYLQVFFILWQLRSIKFNQDDVVLTRSPEVAYFLKRFRNVKVWLSAHSLPSKQKRWWLRRVIKVFDGVICNSQGTSKGYQSLGAKKVLPVPNGVDLSLYDKINLSQDELRKKYNLPLDKYIVTYVGHFYKWKGVGVLLECARLFLKSDKYLFLLVGGSDVDIDYYQKIIDRDRLFNVKLLGYKPPRQIPEILKLSNALVLPNIPLTDESVNFTSPLKMFEYMASQRPIIASDLPSIREVLNDKNCLFFVPGNASDLQDKIIRLSDHPEMAEQLSRQAYQDVQVYSWEKRAQRILDFFL